jgi:hypothetical protein
LNKSPGGAAPAPENLIADGANKANDPDRARERF